MWTCAVVLFPGQSHTQLNSRAPGLGCSMPRGTMNSERPREQGQKNVREQFRQFSHRMSQAVGSPWAFLIACVVIVMWAVMGPAYRYSDTWQLVINTGTTIVTFLMVFLIQNTQNRD